MKKKPFYTFWRLLGWLVLLAATLGLLYALFGRFLLGSDLTGLRQPIGTLVE